jgi:hypothetical protein
VLGFLIDEDREVPGSVDQAVPLDKFSISQLQTVQRVMKLINSLTQAHDKEVIEAYEHCVVRLPAKGYGTIEFGMSENRRNALISAGRAATAAYFQGPVVQPPSPGDIAAGAFETEEALSPADKISTRILDK